MISVDIYKVRVIPIHWNSMIAVRLIGYSQDIMYNLGTGPISSNYLPMHSSIAVCDETTEVFIFLAD